MRLFILALLSSLAVSCATPDHVYLTWRGGTSTTMTINYHTAGALEKSLVRYGEASHAGALKMYPLSAEGASHQIPGLEDGRYVHTVELTGLDAGTEYHFAIDLGAGRDAPEYKFRTVPNDGTPLRFIVGGDMGTLPETWLLMDEAARLDPDFAIIGGDIAYANGKLGNVYLWDRWLSHWQKRMRRSGGAMIPIVAAIGNHETNKNETEPALRAPFYFGFLAQGGSPYFAKRFGPDLALFILDSGHVAEHGGKQAAWLDKALAAHADVKHKIAAYHVPLYPSHRDFDGKDMVAGRTYWVPLFDAYGLDTAFEHHDHTHKRTVPMRGGVPDPAGTLYLGDGNFGTPSRTITQWDRGYLAEASSTGHFWLVDLDENGLRYRAINRYGEVFDEYPEP